MTRIIFIDIDDVLCTMKAHRAAGHKATDLKPITGWPFRCAIDPEGVAILNDATDETVRYVCCSTWRQHMGRERLEAHLRRFGWLGQFHEDWATPILHTAIRGQEITAWIARHPEIMNYAIVDDNATAGIGHEDHFCHIVEQHDGLTRAHLPIIVRALGA